MSKLDWSKANRYEADPARTQRTNDFVKPDPVVISVRDLTPNEKKKMAQKQTRLGKARAKLRDAFKSKRKPKAATTQPRVKPTMSEEDKALAAEARRIAVARHQQLYLAKTRRQMEAAATKRKSHLEAWVEGQKALHADRKALVQTWRSKLLGKRDER